MSLCLAYMFQSLIHYIGDLPATSVVPTSIPPVPAQRVFGRKSASEVRNHYLDTYLCRHGSVLPPFYLDQRPDGTVERVPIPLTGPEPHDSRLNGVEVRD